MRVISDQGKKMWEAFARTGKVEDYIRYTEYLRQQEQSKKTDLTDEIKPVTVDRKENGSAVG